MPHSEPIFHIAFYRFVRLADVDHVVSCVRELAASLTGSIVIAEEGINGVAAGTSDALDSFENGLTGDARLRGAFGGMTFKRTRCTTAPFARLKVAKKREIVAFGVEGADAFDTAHTTVSPQAWRELMGRDDVVVIDNRNSFEYRLGKFKNAIDPKVTHFRDFPSYVEANAPAWKRDGKKVAMYCTGGIRCEKSSAWMERLGLDVYQLDGGILNFFQTLPDADKDWEGDCFVFDNRIAINTQLQETAVTLEQVYEAEPDGAWRIDRAKRLLDAVATPSIVAKRSTRPPQRDGVAASCVVLPSKVGQWPTVIDFLCERFDGVSRTTWFDRMARSEVIDEQGAAMTPASACKPQQKIYYYRSVEAEPTIPFEETIVFQDEYLLVADKPHFLPVAPVGRYVQETLLTRLKRRTGIETLSPIHRIDRDTAGLVIFAIQPPTRDAYQRLFREHRIEKFYEAIAPWRVDVTFPALVKNRLVESPHFMQMQVTEGEANAETSISLLEKSESLGRYKLRPVTGQKHQLRAHMAGLGVPILNDRIYPTLLPDESIATYDKPLQLLAKRVEFVDPMNGQVRVFESTRQLRLAAWT